MRQENRPECPLADRSALPGGCGDVANVATPLGAARDAKALLQVRTHLSAAEEHIGQLQEECASLRRALTAADERGAAASAALAESAAATAIAAGCSASAASPNCVA